MSFNTFGHMFRVTTFGESHGVAIGCVVDGCPPMIPLTEADIQQDLDRRRPGQSRFTTQRQEPDQVKILSGVMAHPETGVQVTTGTPIGLLIENTDQRSKDYSEIKDKFRPGHADFTYEAKYGLRDYRGGGRSSARETAMRVAAGAIARKVLPDVQGPRRAGANRPAQDRPRQMGLGRDCQKSVLLSGQGQGRLLRDLSRRHPQERLVDRRGDRGRRRRRAGRLRCPDLRKTRF
ncbi:hypothetical protein ACVWZ3_001282 [Bradyrhizobium sp. i1.3.6]